MAFGYLGTMGVSIAGKYLMPHYAQLSPLLVQGYRDYFRGGVMDMVNSVIDCWEILANNIYNSSNQTRFCKFIDLYSVPQPKNILASLFSASREKSRKTEDIKETWLDTIFSVLQELTSNTFFLLKNLFQKDPCKYATKRNSIRIDSDSIFSQFGKAMAIGDFNGDGLNELGKKVFL